MEPPLLTFVIFGALFAVFLTIVKIEVSLGRRIALSSVRDRLDTLLYAASRKSHAGWNHFTQYVVKLGWYYSIHSLLSTLLKLLVSMYTYIENQFEKNRTRTKQLRSAKKRSNQQSHLTKIAEHKVETALTPLEKQQLKEEKLELDH